MGYYDNVNLQLLALLDTTASISVELGCGTGALASVLMRRAPISEVIGIEVNKAAATEARKHLPHVIDGDIEENTAFNRLDEILADREIDQVIAGDVLEHLRNPWSVLEKLTDRMSAESSCVVCIPNSAHWSMIAQQLSGRWEYTDQGLFDRTHLRFFTRSSMISLFAQFGFQAEIVQPRFSKKDTGPVADEVISTLQVAAEKFGVPREHAETEYRPLQWLFRFRRSRPKQLRKVRAIAIRGSVPSLASVRVAQPLSSLAGYRPVDWRLSLGDFVLPDPNEQPGILCTYRLHPPEQSPAWRQLDELAARGWLILHDVDDHPAYLQAQRANDFLSIRNAHAVTVSTKNLAEVVRPLNPHVYVVPNQILDMPSLPPVDVGSSVQSLRLLFAALNRKADWIEQCSALEAEVRQGRLNCELSVVDFPELSTAEGKSLRRLPLLDHVTYRKEMMRADVVLCPLLPNEFNLCKSDLKTIESLSNGAIPILSPAAASLTDVSRDCFLVAEHPQDWINHVRQLTQDAAMVVDMKKRGRDWVSRHRMWHAHAPALDQLHDSLFLQLHGLETSRKERLAKHRPLLGQVTAKKISSRNPST